MDADAATTTDSRSPRLYSFTQNSELGIRLNINSLEQCFSTGCLPDVDHMRGMQYEIVLNINLIVYINKMTHRP